LSRWPKLACMMCDIAAEENEFILGRAREATYMIVS
jgi:hypothetical protein